MPRLRHACFSFAIRFSPVSLLTDAFRRQLPNGCHFDVAAMLRRRRLLRLLARVLPAPRRHATIF